MDLEDITREGGLWVKRGTVRKRYKLGEKALGGSNGAEARIGKQSS